MPASYIPYAGPPQNFSAVPEVWEVGTQVTDINGDQWMCVTRGFLGVGGGTQPTFRQITEPPPDVMSLNGLSGAVTLYSPNSTVGITTSGASVGFTAASVSGVPIFPVAAPTGVAATDMAHISAAVAEAEIAGGGTVQLQVGNYHVASSSRTDTVSYASGTWTDASITAADVGKYVIGAGVEGRAPQIVTVDSGVSFTTDIAPGTNISGPVWIVGPGIVQPENVRISGVGGIGSNAGNMYDGEAQCPTRIYDSGTGVTILVRGAVHGNNYNGRYGLQDLTLWGTSNVTNPETAGSALIGLFVSNGAWFYSATDCGFAYYQTAGAAFDYNQNDFNFTNCVFLANGTSAATTQTGGLLGSFFTITAAAGCNVYNCTFVENFGVGIGGGVLGNFCGMYDANISGSQAFDTSATAWDSNRSGVGFLVTAHSTITSCWGADNATADAGCGDGGGFTSIVGCSFLSTQSGGNAKYAIVAFEDCSVIGTLMSKGGGNYVQSIWTPFGATVTWMGCEIPSGGTMFGNAAIGPQAAANMGVGNNTGASWQTFGASSGQGVIALYDSGEGAFRYLTIHEGAVAIASALPT